jgi:hypothetical protein
MDRYKIGEVANIKPSKNSIIVFEYMGRGVEAHLKLKDGDHYVRINEDYTIYNNDDVDNHFREMYGKIIHHYGLTYYEIDELILKCVPNALTELIDDWVKDAQIPQEDLIKLFTTDVNVIRDMMDRYKTKEREPIYCEEPPTEYFQEIYDADGVFKVVVVRDGVQYDYHYNNNGEIIIHTDQELEE